MKVSVINQGSRWTEMLPSKLGIGYINLRRKTTMSGLRKGKGQMVTGIDVYIDSSVLPDRFKNMVREITWCEDCNREPAISKNVAVCSKCISSSLAEFGRWHKAQV